MKKILFGVMALGVMVCGLMACGSGNDSEKPQPGPDPEPETDPAVYAKGADISWVTEQEADGVKFYDAEGKETDCFALMKKIGMNAIRLRVWVNPETAAQKDAKDGGYGSAYSGKDDVVAKAVRAKAQGLAVMIDFHYSNLFADPGRQLTPNAWREKTLEGLCEAVAGHTTEVLNALKAKGVTPLWIQVGNETRPGMLHPTGQLWNEKGDLPNGWANYAKLSNAGYAAAKAVCPQATVMVHIDNAYEDNNWWFDKFKAAGGKFDMIGLSHYPQVADKASGWKEANSLALKHIEELAARYNVPVMVSEVGVIAEDSGADACLKEFMEGARKISQCKGVFYWEPQVYNGWRPKVYREVFGWGAYNMGGFTKEGRPAAFMEMFK